MEGSSYLSPGEAHCLSSPVTGCRVAAIPALEAPVFGVSSHVWPVRPGVYEQRVGCRVVIEVVHEIGHWIVVIGMAIGNIIQGVPGQRACRSCCLLVATVRTTTIPGQLGSFPDHPASSKSPRAGYAAT